MPEPFQISIYQLADDSLLKKNRTDGLGWDLRYADTKRQWMDLTHGGFAYRCLPLTIMNQIGWQVLNPVTVEAVWNGNPAPGNILFRFSNDDPIWPRWINDQFGHGIITWNTPYLFKTQPEGSRLIVMGPPNDFKPNLHPLTALIESDWMNMSFTMNWKIGLPHIPIRFPAGDPLFQIVPLSANLCSHIETAQITYQKLSDDPAVLAEYHAWQSARNTFHEQKRQGTIKPDAWQRDYFTGKTIGGDPAATQHYTKIKPPKIQGL